ncbi:hypothetical protein ACFQJD_07580 [Haloplanus sp. GCM10025708]
MAELADYPARDVSPTFRKVELASTTAMLMRKYHHEPAEIFENR